MGFQHFISRIQNKVSILGLGVVIGLVVALGLGTAFFPMTFQPQASGATDGMAASVRGADLTPSPTGEGILAFNQHLISIAKHVKPAVVNISVVGTNEEISPFSESPFFNDPFFRRFFGERFEQPRRQLPKRREQGMGSGVLISSDGYIVTNNHVVEAGDDIQVLLADSRKFEAKLIGTDSKTDLAIIKIDASNLPYLSWGDSNNLQVGEMVVAIGNPFGLNQTVTMGIISAVGRANVGIVDYEDFIQTDAAINPGNSGGALVNLQGELIGINTAIFSRSGGYMGIGFAIPSNMAKNVCQSLQEHGKVVRGWLGVSIQNLNPELAEQFDTPDTNGALVADVVEDSPADDAKFQRGDIIRKYDGREVENSTKLRSFVAETPPGTTVKIQVLRDGREQSLLVEIGQLPKDLAGLGSVGTVGERHALSGLTVESIKPGESSEDSGVRVTEVDPDSRAADAGIRKNDILLEINREKIGNVEDFDRITRRLEERDSALVLLRRGRSTIFLSIGGK